MFFLRFGLSFDQTLTSVDVSLVTDSGAGFELSHLDLTLHQLKLEVLWKICEIFWLSSEFVKPALCKRLKSPMFLFGCASLLQQGALLLCH